MMPLMVWANFLIAGCNYQERQQQDFEKSFEQKWHESYNSLSREKLSHVLQSNKDNLTDSMYQVYHHQIDQKPNTDTLTIDMNRVRKWPLGTMKLPHSLWRLLWNNYPSELFYRYNPELRDTLNNTKNLDRVSYDKVTTENIKIPAVYPELADFFVPSLQDFIAQHPECKELIWDDKEVIIVTRDENNKYVTAHYDGYYIKACHYGAPGTLAHKSPEWVYYTNLNKDRMRYTKDSIPKSYYDRWDRQDSTKKSKKYDDAAMPYATPIAKDSIQTWVYLHTRQVIVWILNKLLSHWCLGQTGYFSLYLYDNINNRKVKVVIFNLYDKKQKLTTKSLSLIPLSRSDLEAFWSYHLLQDWETHYFSWVA